MCVLCLLVVRTTRRLQFISYWSTRRRMRTVQIDGVKRVHGENERALHCTLQTAQCKSNSKCMYSTGRRQTIMTHWKLPWTVCSHSPALASASDVCTLVIYSQQLLNDCGDVTRHTCSAIDANSFVIYHQMLLNGWLYCVQPSTEWTPSSTTTVLLFRPILSTIAHRSLCNVPANSIHSYEK